MVSQDSQVHAVQLKPDTFLNSTAVHTCSLTRHCNAASVTAPRLKCDAHVLMCNVIRGSFLLLSCNNAW